MDTHVFRWNTRKMAEYATHAKNKQTEALTVNSQQATMPNPGKSDDVDDLARP